MLKFIFPILLLIKRYTSSVISFEQKYRSPNDVAAVSKYLHNTSIEYYHYPKPNVTSLENRPNPVSLNINGTYSMELIENDGILINDIMIRSGNVTLQRDLNYTIYSGIDDYIIPHDYFKNGTFNYQCLPPNDCTPMLDCLYFNKNPHYSYGTFNNLSVDRFVSFKDYNFGISSNSSGIQVISLVNFTFGYQTLDTFLSNHQDLTYTDGVTFSHIHASTPQFEDHDYLIGESNNGTLYIYQLESRSNVSFSMNYYAKVNQSVINMLDYKQVDVYKNLLILGGDEGFVIANRTDPYFSNWGIVFKGNWIKVKDFIVNNKTVYIIEKDFGLRVFDLVKMEFSNFEFQHPGMVKFDYSLDQQTGIYYVGIIIDNSPPEINEVLIELIVHPEDDMEYTPHINQVFTSKNKYPSSNIVTDQFYGYTYLFDSQNLNIYIISRYNLEKYNFYSYKLDLKDYIIRNFKDLAPTNTLYILSDARPGGVGSLLLQNNDDYIIVRDFSHPPNTLTCMFNTEGDYEISVTHDKYCSNLALNGPSELDKCNTKLAWVINVHAEDKGLLLGVLGFIIILIVLVIVGIVCFKTGCLKRGGKKGSNKYGTQYIEAGVIEVNVDQMKT
jgi:hypothetical protein